MSENSAVLSLPYIQSSQAQKYVTHNEAIRVLDVLVQASVTSQGQVSPPDNPAQGERHIVGAAATGDWSGQDQAIALWSDSSWQFYLPQAGWHAFNLTEGQFLIFNGSTWVAQTFETLGINTTADTVNRLAVTSAATLLTHEGAGHQLKINKAATAETASLLFQSNWSGRAEMGCAGSDAFSIKVSADGSDWTTAFSLDPATGVATGAAVQTSASDVSEGRLARADYVYGPGNLIAPVSESVGVPTGGVIESGETEDGQYIRWADGTQICLLESGDLTADTALGAVFESLAAALSYPIPFITPPQISCGYKPVSGSGGWASLETTGDAASLSVKMFSALSGTVGRIMIVAVGRWSVFE